MERSLAVSRDMVEVAGERDSAPRTADAERLGKCTGSGAPVLPQVPSTSWKTSSRAEYFFPSPDLSCGHRI